MLDREGWYEVAVEIGRGSIWRGASANVDRYRCLLQTERDWKTDAQMGRSVGRRDALDNSGTLGGFIEILSPDTGNWKRYGLTCSHCVEPSSEPTSDLEALQKHSIQGGAQSIDMDQPSSGDHQETLLFLKDAVDNLRTEEHKSTEKQLNDPQDFMLPHIETKFRRDEYIIQLYEKQIEVGEELFRRNQAENGYTLDWALIDVKQERVSQNKLLSLEEVALGSSNVARLKLYNPVKNRVVGAQALLVWPGESLFKFGRSTDFTWGIQNGVRECRLLGWREDKDGVQREETYDDYQVVGMPSVQPFGLPGDSGAFVLNGEGAFVGLFFGGNTILNTGYYTAAEDLFASIRSVTGAAEVRLPDLELNENK